MPREQQQDNLRAPPSCGPEVERPGRGPPSTLPLPSALVVSASAPQRKSYRDAGSQKTEDRLLPTAEPTVWAIAPEAAPLLPASRASRLPVSRTDKATAHISASRPQSLQTLLWHTAFSILTQRPCCCCNSSCLLGEMTFRSQDFHSPHLPHFTNGGKPCQDLVCPDFLVGRRGCL